MDKVRKEVRKIVSEILLREIEIEEMKPEHFEEFKMNGEFQYGFKTENENIYYLSLKETKIKTNNKEVLNLLKNEINEDGTVEFYAANFYEPESNPNSEVAFDVVTNRNEQFKILSNIIWLIKNFSKNHKIKTILFSAEPRRMRLYSNTYNNFKDEFIIVGPDNFDSSYKHKQVLLIKK